MQLSEWVTQVHDLAVEKGWYDPPKTFGEIIALFHAECSEALEEFRNGHEPSEIYVKDGKPEGVPVEFADILIRVLDTCAHFGIDIEAAMQMKHEFNKTRPHRHGGKVI